MKETDEIKALKELAKKIRKEKKSKEEILAFFQSAKILTKNGNFTKPYKNLNKIFINKK
ncbi:hypothetical protein [Gynurincola endophyticus]|jgi:uncharacterized protein YecE (DUF72 family)|uniref:hypothetical protein n=1 Tax=Gynurincola endophyticus TaxID=2479004 RepID=UPI00131574FA|nr:hypothetical protein [Gynurincola endophyticus]